jgi:hypothetical protein
MMRALTLVLALMMVLARPAAAQESGPLVRYGKWALAAGAVGMNLLAAQAHNRAEEAFDAIEDACFDDPSACRVDSDGSYQDPRIEGLYQTTLRHDRRARTWLIAGETALLGAAALFVLEFTRKKHKPDNIPFEPEVRSLRHATGIGVRVAW